MTIALNRFDDIDGSGHLDAYTAFLDDQANRMRTRTPDRVASLGIRSGDVVLDIGCGPAIWTFDMEAAAGPTGRVVGIDFSVGMVAEAAIRAEARGSKAEFRVGDVRSLDLPNDVFDLVTCSLLLLHVDDVDASIREMVRVTKPGGRVVAHEPDHQMSVIDGTDPVLTERVIRTFFGTLHSPRIGRQLHRRFVEAGLGDVSVEAKPLVVNDWDYFASRFTSDRLAGSGTDEEVADVVTDLAAHGSAKTFWGCFMTFDATGTKPT